MSQQQADDRPSRSFVVQKRDFGGFHTEIGILPAEGGTPGGDGGTLLFFVPGNPGVISFYSLFLEQLHVQLNHCITIVGVGQAGHNSSDPTIYSLQQQIDHKCAVLDSLVASVRPSRVILCGHSLGAYVAMQVMAKRPSLNITQAILLYPLLCGFKEGCPSAVRVAMLPGFRHALGCFVQAIGWLPKPAFGALFGYFFKLHAELRLLDKDLLTYGMVNNVLYLSACERDEIEGLPEDFLKDNIDKLSFRYTLRDHWAPVSVLNQLRSRFPGHTNKMVLDADGTPHAFVIGHATSMAAKVATTVRDCH